MVWYWIEKIGLCVCVGEENEEEGGLGERGDLIYWVVVGIKYRRWKYDGC